MKYIICYDISDNCKRNQIAHLLESIAVRFQFSVFIADICENELVRLKEKLAAFADDVEDCSIIIIPLCARCEGKIWYSRKMDNGFNNSLVQDFIVI